MIPLDIRLLTGPQLPADLHATINNATPSIWVTTYVATIPPKTSWRHDATALHALATCPSKTSDRRIWLPNPTHLREGDRLLRPAAAFFGDLGWSVYVCRPSVRLHAKLIALGTTVLYCGSANLTERGSTENAEATLRVASYHATIAAQHWMLSLSSVLVYHRGEYIPLPHPLS